MSSMSQQLRLILIRVNETAAARKCVAELVVEW